MKTNCGNERCSLCGERNNDVVEVVLEPQGLIGYISKFLGTNNIKICQSCGSKIFRSFVKTK